MIVSVAGVLCLIHELEVGSVLTRKSFRDILFVLGVHPDNRFESETYLLSCWQPTQEKLCAMIASLVCK